MRPDTDAPAFLSFIPLITMGLLVGIFALFIAKRKGKNPLVCFLLCLIPIFGGAYLFYLVSLTDKAVLERLDYLENLLKGSKKTSSIEPA